MGVMAREQSGVRPNDRPIVTGLLITYGLFWIGLAIAPVDRQDWFLENLLAVALVAVLVLTYRRFAFSLPAYCLILAFLLLHAIGAHYTYSEVPFGFWLKDALALSRNPLIASSTSPMGCSWSTRYAKCSCVWPACGAGG